MATGNDPREQLMEEVARDNLLEEAERRRFLYHDLETMVTVGFLTCSLQLGTVDVVLRTLPLGHRLRIDILGEHSLRDWKRHYLASAVWMIDGLDVSIIPNAPFYLHRWWLKDLDRRLVDVMMSQIMGLRRRIERAHDKIEAFCYEPFGRGLWRLRPTVPIVVPNTVEQTWAAFNKGEDRRTDDLDEWNRTQVIVSSMSHKGGKAVRRQLDLTQSREEARKAKSIEDMVNRVIRGPEKELEDAFVMINGRPVKVPRISASRSVAELQEEMRRALAGEKDLHDLAVEAYEERIRKAVAARKAEAEKRYSAQVEMDGMMRMAGIGGATKLVGYSPAQLMAARPDLKVATKGVKQQQSSPEAHRIYERYVEKGTQVGWLGAKGVPEPASAKGPGGGNLQKTISERKASFRSDPMPSPGVKDPDG